MTFHCWRIVWVAVTVIAGLDAAPLLAADPAYDPSQATPSIASNLPNNGDPTGARQWLSDHGITYGLIFTNDVLSNLSGGLKRGSLYQGKVEGQLTVDMEKLAGWQDLTLYANGFQIDNTGRIRRDYVGGINTIAAIEAVPTVRLSELWLERKFGNATIRAGQLAADSEFFYSEISAMFMQSDWPTIAAANLPSGGPAYPLSTPGVRVKYTTDSKDMTFLLAIFNGNPAGPGLGDPEIRNRYGLNFRLQDSPLIIGEAQFRANQDAGLARTLKLGAWDHLGQFDDQRHANDGSLLANPAGSGIPAKHRGDFGIYGIIDQQIYRPQNGAPDSGITVFSRASLSPSDRNLIDKYIDGGIVFAGLLPSRPKDRFGASVIYARYSEGARAFDQDRINFGLTMNPVRDYETSLELTYIAVLVPGWTLQPDFQIIWHPSGGQSARDAKVTSLRTVLKF
jgi:porin